MIDGLGLRGNVIGYPSELVIQRNYIACSEITQLVIVRPSESNNLNFKQILIFFFFKLLNLRLRPYDFSRTVT